MDKPSPSIRDLARRLLTASHTAADPDAHEATQVCGTLGVSLTSIAGADGFKSLLSRALALASAEVPSLERISSSTF